MPGRYFLTFTTAQSRDANAVQTDVSDDGFCHAFNTQVSIALAEDDLSLSLRVGAVMIAGSGPAQAQREGDELGALLE